MKIKGEWKIIIIVLLSSLLFAWGGTGFKAARRFIMPLILASGGVWLGLSPLGCIISLPLIIGATSLGYGENTPFLFKTLTTLSFAVCLVPMAHKKNALLTLIVPVVFGLNYYLSLNVDFWTWKLVELATGFAFGFTVVLLALSRKK